MLFGHQNDDTNQPAAVPASDNVGVNPLAVDPATGASLPTAPEPPSPADLEMSSVLNQPTSDQTDSNSTEPTPLGDVITPSVMSEPQTADASSPTTDTDSTPAPVDPPAPLTSATDDSTTAASPTDDALLALKQQALAQLSPLVGQLDQTPEEKFRTTMMMIQSTDNQSLIQAAYDAAQAIPDEKVKAQALLDVINEINYFTQQKSAE